MSKIIRISTAAYEKLNKLAQNMETTNQFIIEKALDRFERENLLIRANEAYADLKKNPKLLQEVAQEEKDWEITIGDAPPRHYMLRLSAVTSGDEGTGQILGLVAALSDVTQQHELEEMKTDVMTLVTHELLTPLTAIQGMSEVLATVVQVARMA